MYKKLTALLSTVCALMAAPAAANIHYCQPAGGLYVGAFGGANWLQLSSYPRDFSAKEFQPGSVVGGALGYRCVAPLRIEAEMSYRENSLDHIQYLSSKYGYDVRQETWAYMGNLLVDFNLYSVKPYAGVGVGYTETDASDSIEDAAFKFKDQGYAWQTIAGVAFPMANTMDLAIEYRYFQAKKQIRNHSLGVFIRLYL